MSIFTRILGGGTAWPGSGTVWGHQHQSYDMDASPFCGDFCGRSLYSCCAPLTTCLYLLCCCCLLRDCFGNEGGYDYGPQPPPFRPTYGGFGPAPPEPEPPFDLPGPTSLPVPPGPPGGPVERPYYY